jgi:integrase/recombinase XerD
VTGPDLTAEGVRAAFLRGHQHSTREAYARDLGRWFTWCDEAGVDPLTATGAHVEAWVAQYRDTPRRGRAPAESTVARAVSAVRQLYAYAVALEVIGVNPVPRGAGSWPKRSAPRP